VAWHTGLTSPAARYATSTDRLYNSIDAAESNAAMRWFLKLEETIGLLASSPHMGAVTHEDCFAPSTHLRKRATFLPGHLQGTTLVTSGTAIRKLKGGLVTVNWADDITPS